MRLFMGDGRDRDWVCLGDRDTGGDELYPNNFSTKAEYKLANLMKHKYEIKSTESGVRLTHGKDDLIILPNGKVFSKVIY